MDDDARRGLIEKIEREWADKGRLVEGGWRSLRAVAIPEDAPAVQLREMRLAYMAGAQHLFSSLMTILDAGDDATEAALRRMDLIAKELNGFVEEMKRDVRFRAAFE